MSPLKPVLLVAGIVAASALAAPAAQAAPFAPPQLLNPATTLGLLGSKLAVGPGGGAAVAFAKYEPAEGYDKMKLFVSLHEQGAQPTATAARGFSEAVAVSPTGRYPNAFDVGVDASGNTTLFYWVGTGPEDFTEGEIYTRYRPARGAWTEPQLISTQKLSETSANVTPKLVVSASGRAVLLTEKGVFERAPGVATFTQIPNTYNAQQIAMNRWGDLAVAQLTTVTGAAGPTLSVRIRPAGGEFGTARSLGVMHAIGTLRDPDQSAIAVTDNGTVVVLWSPATKIDPAKRGTGLKLSVRKPGTSVANGTWSATETVPTTDETASGGYTPAAKAFSNTEVLIQWSQTSSTDPDGTTVSQVVPSTTSPVPPQDFVDVGVSTKANGRAVATKFTADSGNLKAYVRTKTGDPFGAEQTVLAKYGTTRFFGSSVALDDEGNGYILFTRLVLTDSVLTSNQRVGISGYDPVAPKISSVFATAGKAGTASTLGVLATDRMSAPTATWVFGDGTTGTGTLVSHTYAKAGTYTAKVTARDEAGNTVSWNKTIVVPAS